MLGGIESEEKSVNINIRAGVRQRDLIDMAARLTGRTRSDFMLSSATAAAADAILDQRLFALDAARHRAFIEALEQPLADNAGLRALLARQAPWER